MYYCLICSLSSFLFYKSLYFCIDFLTQYICKHKTLYFYRLLVARDSDYRLKKNILYIPSVDGEVNSVQLFKHVSLVASSTGQTLAGLVN